MGLARASPRPGSSMPKNFKVCFVWKGDITFNPFPHTRGIPKPRLSAAPRLGHPA